MEQRILRGEPEEIKRLLVHHDHKPTRSSILPATHSARFEATSEAVQESEPTAMFNTRTDLHKQAWDTNGCEARSNAR